MLDQPGLMARTVADAAFVADAISGRDEADEQSLDWRTSLADAADDDGRPPRFSARSGALLGRRADARNPPRRGELLSRG